jgi:hypothetical protein
MLACALATVELALPYRRYTVCVPDCDARVHGYVLWNGTQDPDEKLEVFDTHI